MHLKEIHVYIYIYKSHDCHWPTSCLILSLERNKSKIKTMCKEVCMIPGLPLKPCNIWEIYTADVLFPFVFCCKSSPKKCVRSVVLIQVVSNAGWFAELIIAHHVICSWSTVKKNATIAMGSTINYRGRQLQCSTTGLVPLGDSTIKPGGVQPITCITSSFSGWCQENPVEEYADRQISWSPNTRVINQESTRTPLQSRTKCCFWVVGLEC